MAHQGFHAIVDCDFKAGSAAPTDAEKALDCTTIARWRTSPPTGTSPAWPASVTIGTVSLMAEDSAPPHKPGGQVRVEAYSSQTNDTSAHADFQDLEQIIKKQISDFNSVKHTCCYIDF